MVDVLPNIEQPAIGKAASEGFVEKLADIPEPGTKCGTHGERLIVEVVDEYAQRTPERLWATVTKSQSSLEDGFQDITMAQLASSTNQIAWMMHEKFGKSNNFDVVAYIGLSDVRYAMYLLGAIKTGRQLMIPSVRNSASQHVAVFQEAKCTKVFYTPEMSFRIAELQQALPDLEACTVPSLDDILSTPNRHYEYNKTWESARTDPIIVAHSSGSTGNPKPTTITNGVYSVYDSHRKIPPIPGRKIQSYGLLELGGNRFFNPFPPFHLAGLFAMTIMPVFYNCVVAMLPPTKPPSGELLSQAMRALPIRAAWCPPSVIEQLVDQPGGFEQLASLDWIMYTGGPLAPSVGDRICHVTDVCQLYGSTETGPHIAMVPLPENWNYFEWHPELENEMDPVGDGSFEMVVHRKPELDWIRHLSQAYPEIETWRTRDLFVQAPHNPRLWRFVGRRDDVIVLSNGEKFNPVNMEGVVTGHPLVRGAVVSGTARIQSALLVEPSEPLEGSLDDFIAQLWPTVEQANAVGPSHGRIFRSKIVVATPSKPFLRASKGTIIRGQTNKLYADELDALYNDGAEENMEDLPVEALDCLESVTRLVRRGVEQIFHGSSIEDTEDLFVRGVDSLQTLELTRSLNKALARSSAVPTAALLAKNIYANSTIQQLSRFIHRARVEGVGGESDESQRVLEMRHLKEKYAGNFAVKTRPAPQCVALTGSTGSLGTRTLRGLLNDGNITKVYCLNRSPDADERHHKAFKSWKPHNVALEQKLEFLTVQLGEPTLGLPDSKYAELRDRVDALIHNAWAVNFNQALSSFEDTHIRGVRNLIDLVSSSARNPHLFFISSLSSVGNWPAVYGAHNWVPEAPIEDPRVALAMGYGESKAVAEQILQSAIVRAGIKATTLRVGQIAGPLGAEDGQWNTAEWFPSLIKTSKALGMLPDSMGAVDWIPLDQLAQIMTELLQHDYAKGWSQVLNLVNPHSANWSELVGAIVKHWEPAKTRIVPWEEWMQALQGVDDPDLAALPALKIFEFYEGISRESQTPEEKRVRYETGKARHSSGTMDGLAPISAAAMETWLRQWQF